MVLNPTPSRSLTDASGYPYFLWDVSITLETFQQHIQSPDTDIRAYWVAKLMRQAKPDDVFSFVTLNDIRALWPKLVPYLGEKRAFWEWLLEQWADNR